MKYETMSQIVREKLDGRAFTGTERFLWMAWVNKDESYRMVRTIALLGWALALTGPLVIIFG
jgi:hypothetical protein